MCVKGDATVSNFLLYFSTIMGFSHFLKSIISDISFMKMQNHDINTFRVFIEESELETCTSNESISKTIEKVEFIDVSFKYPGSEKYALKDINVVLDGKKNYAVVGKNGAGKSTLIKLILKLYEVNSGDIYVSGVNIRNLDYDNYLYRISALFQDFKLFSISIKDNICMQDSVDESRLENAIKWVGLDEIIKEFPKGVDALYYLRI